MDDSHIEDMARALVNAGLISEGKSIEVAAVLAGCWRHKIALTWDVGDVMTLERSVSMEDAVEVLARVKKEHSPAIGINFTNLQDYVDEVVGHRV